MNQQTKNIAIILAGGTGTRLSSKQPKQLLSIAGRSVLAHTVAAFATSSCIDEIAVVAHVDWQTAMQQSIEEAGLQVQHWITGGNERYESSLSAIRYCQAHIQTVHPEITYRLLFHDAARCLVSQTLIDRVCQALEQYKAVNLLIPLTDSIVQASTNGIWHSLDRSRLRAVQTPQAFHLDTIAQAYDLALAAGESAFTDDIGVVSHFLPQEVVGIVEGEHRNFKITYPQDLDFAELLLNQDKPQ